MNTKMIGEISESQVIAKLLLNREIVLTPFGDNQRYDLVIENNNTFERIQIKTGRLKNGAIKFASASTYAHRGGKRKDYVGEIDYFMIFCPENMCIYKIPINIVGSKTQFWIRIDSPKNNQVKGISWAKDYLYS